MNIFTLIPVLITLAFATVFQAVLEGLILPQPVLTPFEETSGDVTELASPSPYLNTLLVLAIIFLGSLLMIALLRYKKALRVFVVSVMMLTATSVTYLYLLVTLLADEFNLLLLATLLGGLIVWGIFAERELVNVLASSYVAASCGVVFSISAPFWTTLILLVAVSAYDLLAVFRGHLRVMGKIDLGELKGLVVNFRGLSIGMGDLFFYTVLFSFVTTNFGWLPGVAAVTGLMVGYLLTLKLAEKRPVFPGLPLTLITALALSIAVYLLIP